MGSDHCRAMRPSLRLSEGIFNSTRYLPECRVQPAPRDIEHLPELLSVIVGRESDVGFNVRWIL